MAKWWRLAVLTSLVTSLQQISLAKEFEKLVKNEDQFELIGEVEMGLVCFRHKVLVHHSRRKYISNWIVLFSSIHISLACQINSNDHLAIFYSCVGMPTCVMRACLMCGLSAVHMTHEIGRASCRERV